MAIDLDEAERIGKAATAGEWSVYQIYGQLDNLICFIARPHPTMSDAIEHLCEMGYGTESDAMFIVFARNNWQAMVDEIRELRRRVIEEEKRADDWMSSGPLA